MYVLIRSRLTGIIEDVELFKIHAQAISWGCDQWGYPRNVLHDIRERLTKFDRYEDDDFIITIVRKSVRS